MKNNFTVRQEVDIKRVSDLLCSAWEGGSAYWARVEKAIAPKFADYGSKENGAPYIHEYALSRGGSVTLRDIEDDTIIERKLTRAIIARGLQIMASDYPKHWGDFMSENDDATTGDVFLQCCIFEKVIYG